jgi:glycosyltransferase involved in cell wall biosynthesis
MARQFDGPRPALLYAGDGPERPALESLRRSLDVCDDVYLVGYRADAASLVGSADVAVVPSVWDEACPLAVLEPMARGVSVVATRVGGIPELIDDGVTGLLVPRGDERSLADRILVLLRDPARARAMGRLARLVVAERFVPERQLDALASVVSQGFGLRRDRSPKAETRRSDAL